MINSRYRYYLLLSGLLLIACIIMFCNATYITRHFIYNSSSEAYRLLQIFYPKFNVALSQFSADFFIYKIKEVSLRLFIGGNLILYIHYLIYSKNILISLNKSISDRKIEFYVCILFPYLFYTVLSWYSGFQVLHTIQHQYKPISFLKLLPDVIASATSIHILWIMLLASIICVLFSKHKFVASISVAILFLTLETIFNSFGKISHGYTPIIYCSLLFPLFYSSHQKEWVLRLIQLSIVACYTFAALEKIINSGYQWFNGDQLHRYLIDLSPYQHCLIDLPDIIFSVFAIGIILFQLSFGSILFYKKIRPYYLIAGFLFHIGIYIILDVGYWLHPWVISYVFFINSDFLSNFYHQTAYKKQIDR